MVSAEDDRRMRSAPGDTGGATGIPIRKREVSGRTANGYFGKAGSARAGTVCRGGRLGEREVDTPALERPPTTCASYRLLATDAQDSGTIRYTRPLVESTYSSPEASSPNESTLPMFPKSHPRCSVARPSASRKLRTHPPQ